MRLLHTKDFRLVEDKDPEFQTDPRYAIVSHRWLPGETESLDFSSRDIAGDSSPVIKKVRGACKQASDDGFSWIWIDSVCIDRSNAVELGRAINSMFKCYRKATICYTYLSDVVMMDTPRPDTSIFNRHREDASADSDDQGEVSEWFSRGWTLQELLAPANMQFFARDWSLIGTKQQLAPLIAKITDIDVGYLTGEKDFREACIAAKLSWMANRRTTEEEDRAYSMLGIFDIPMEVIYGEGKRAFTRLQKHLLETCADESIFAWRTPSAGLPNPRGPRIVLGRDEWGLIAPSPECFAGLGDVVIKRKPGRIARYGVNTAGVYISHTSGRVAVSYGFMKSRLRKLGCHLVFFILWAFWTSLLIDPVTEHYVVGLDCYRKTTDGLKTILIHISKPGPEPDSYRRIMCSKLETELLSVGSRGRWYNSRMEEGFVVLQPEPDD